MGKRLTAEQVKKLPVGTDVLMIQETAGKIARLWIVKSGRKKMLHGVLAIHEIKDLPGWHYELADKKEEKK